jgi:hypothetical protein
LIDFSLKDMSRVVINGAGEEMIRLIRLTFSRDLGRYPADPHHKKNDEYFFGKVPTLYRAVSSYREVVRFFLIPVALLRTSQ